MTTVLEIKRLVVDYGGEPVLNVGDMSLAVGSLSGIIGTNGAGKSTLVNSVLGWSRGKPRIQAQVFLDGEDISKLQPAERVRRGLLLVPEGRNVYMELTVDENLQAVIETSRENNRKPFTIDEIFDLFPRLAERRRHKGSALSGGERQMLAISRALRTGPRTLMLDEPSIGLAPKLVLAVLLAIRKLVDNGLTVLLVEQNVHAAIEVVDDLFLLERGKFIASGPVDQMRDDPRIIEAYLGAKSE